jgi:FAD/FMN-containing dehydrogenase
MNALLESGSIADGVAADSETKLASLWGLREAIPESAGKLGSVYKYDVSLPVGEMYGLVETAREKFAEKGMDKDGTVLATMGYGHVGDCTFSLFQTSFRAMHLTKTIPVVITQPIFTSTWCVSGTTLPLNVFSNPSVVPSHISRAG